MLSNNTKYTPKARSLPYEPNFWENARKKGLGTWLELDLYKYTENLVQKLLTESPDVTSLQTLHQTAMWGTSLQFSVVPGLHKIVFRGWIASSV